ncbi:restriction endonuclease subunit S [Aeromonas sp. QDB05]|uniref:restriction endonuclease subunit S n=2 Tax=Aeromonas TaxID=642 RepID=UPI0022E02CBC|nr:restriction endonuclease subunit S [Aeromonas sp. QDB05]
MGVIPEDWIVEPLENFTSFISYGFTNPMPTTVSGPFMITARDISNGKIQYGDARATSAEAFDKYLTPKSKPKKSDLLLTKDGTLGRLALVDDELICINQSVAILRPNERVSPDFFKSLLESPFYQGRMIDDAGGSTIKHIYITIVNKMLLGMPSNKAEQTAIANVLSDSDALIGALEQLIAKKQAIKSATMQQLLTGRTRLPAFALRPDGTPKGYKPSELGEIPEDWEAKKMGGVAQIQRGASPRPIDSPVWFDRNSSVGWLRISDVTKTVKYLFDTTQSLSEMGVAHSRFVSSNNLVMSICATVGKPIITKKDLCIHDGFVVFHGLTVNQDYMYYVLKDLEDEWGKQGQTGSQMNLNTDLINGTLIALPREIEEQTAIATILSDMDNELQALTQKLEKARALKQGMMQQLLTGKIRLPLTAGA